MWTSFPSDCLVELELGYKMYNLAYSICRGSANRKSKFQDLTATHVVKLHSIHVYIEQLVIKSISLAV